MKKIKQQITNIEQRLNDLSLQVHRLNKRWWKDIDWNEVMGCISAIFVFYLGGLLCVTLTTLFIKHL